MRETLFELKVLCNSFSRDWFLSCPLLHQHPHRHPAIFSSDQLLFYYSGETC